MSTPRTITTGLAATSRRALVSLLAVATILVAMPSAASAARARTDGELLAESIVATLHNEARANPAAFGYPAEAPRAALTAYTDIREVARGWSDQQAAARDMSHNPSYSSQLCCWNRVAENVAFITVNSLDAAAIEAASRDIFQSWMDSSGHRRNILGDFDQFGLGVSITPYTFSSCSRCTAWALYLTGNFRRHNGAPVPGTPYATAQRSDVPAELTTIAGADAAATSSTVSAARFDRADVVLISTSERYPDALAAAALSRRLGAPLLLTPSATLSDDVRAEAVRLRPRQLVILGGPNAVADHVVAGLEAATGAAARRVNGASRFETAVAIANEAGAGRGVDTVFIVEGAHADPNRGWPDALSASWVVSRTDAAIGLVTRDSLHPATRAMIVTHAPRRVVIVGGAGAVSAAVESDLRASFPATSVERWSGSDRFATSVEVVRRAGLTVEATTFATGLDFTSALVAGASAWADGSALFLVHGTATEGASGVYDHVRASLRGVDATIVTAGGEVASAVIGLIREAVGAA